MESFSNALIIYGKLVVQFKFTIYKNRITCCSGRLIQS